MLKIVDVPKGTKFLTVDTTGNYFTESPAKTYTHTSSNVSHMLMLPVPGSPPQASKMFDPGFLAQGEDHGGQKDVEHLDLDGTLFPKETFSAFGLKDPAKAFPSTHADRWYCVPYTFRGSSYTRWFSLACGTTGYVGMSRDMVGKLQPDTVEHPWRAIQVVGWVRSNLACSFQVFRRLDDSASVTVYTTVWKFSDDWSMCAIYGLSVPCSTLPSSSVWQAYWTLISDRVFSDSVGRSLTLVVADRVLITTRNSGPIEVPSFNVYDRSRIFRGELNPDWGDLAYDCYKQIQLWSNNAIAYVRDLTMVTRSLKELVNIAKSLLGSKNPVKLAKSLADLFLSFRYGWFLTAKDTVSLIGADYDYAYPEGRCKRSTAFTYFRNGVTTVARMSVYCRPYSDCISELDGFLRMMDLELTLENIWDLVPFSFVVDWIVNVGGLLDRMDQMGSLDKYQIFLTGKSLKATTLLAAEEIPELAGMVGPIYSRYYKRVYSTDVTQPSLVSSRDSSQKFNHWIEGSALAIQRLR